jgi:outer membrane receptor for ferrienterochelin and colicin
VALTGSIGTYYKIPTYTSLGYRDSSGNLVNKDMKYIQSTHYVIGTEYLPNKSLRFVLEAFYKKYNNYPVSIKTGESLANQGNEFGAIGSEEVSSTGTGETYGFEVSAQQKMTENLFYVISYTYVESKYAGSDGVLHSSSWDNRHLLSATFGYIFKHGYELGLKYRFAGGNPYTPYNETVSRETYLLLGSGTLDYKKINSLRMINFNQLDLRVNKKFYLKKSTIEAYIDVQNILGFENQSMPVYTFKRKADNSGFETTDGKVLKQDGSNGIPVILNNKDVTVVPTLGVMIEF